jgi:DinB superfamily
MDADQHAREEILYLLRGGNAHMSLDEAVADYPMASINTPFPNGMYTAWHLLEHMRLTQADILDFIRNPSYAEREWPRDYWPPQDRMAAPDEWRRTLDAFREDARALQAIVADPATDLYARIPHGDGQTIFREMLVVADHNAYHLGEFAIMRQVMGTWQPGR